MFLLNAVKMFDNKLLQTAMIFENACCAKLILVNRLIIIVIPIW